MRRGSIVRKLFPVVCVVGCAAILGISGCENSYPESLEYPVRNDAVILNSDALTKMIELPIYPDPLGVMPLATAKGFTDERLTNYFDKEFKLSKLFKDRILVDPTRISSKTRRLIAAVLKRHFGTPAEPKVDLSKIPNIDPAQESEIKQKLALGDQELANGSRLYRLHCLHCHGLTGDGRGVTARWVNPHPRDYRLGWFKFLSSDNDKGAKKPLRSDLLRTLREGIEGTSMPSFRLLSSDDLEALVSYVIHLSIRGEAENTFLALKFAYHSKSNSFRPVPNTSVVGDLRKAMQLAVTSWSDAQDKPIEPVAYPYPTLAEATAARADSKERKEFVASVDRGFKIFGAACIVCHEDYGRKAPYKVDLWGTMTKPADLTLGVYRGGRRPIDLYYRIHSGIFPSGMAPVEASTQLKLSPNDAKKQEVKIRGDAHMWDLVNFVRVLPYRGMLRKLTPAIHDQVYGP